MAQDPTTQEQRTARIRELTDWTEGDYERFATESVERQMRLIAANAPSEPVIDWNRPISDEEHAAWDAMFAAGQADVEYCERRA